MVVDEFQYVPEPQLAVLIAALHRCAQRQIPITMVGVGLPQLRGQTGKAKSYEECYFWRGPCGRAARGAPRSACSGGGVAVALRRRARGGRAGIGRERGPVRGRAPLRTKEALDDRECGPEPWPALRARRRRWAELLRRVFAVDVEVCPRCGGEMRIVAFVTEHAVVTRILAHLQRRGVDPRAGPWAAAAAKRRACGFRNRERFRTAIYFHCGGLDLYPACMATSS